jgi:hypothetical protein
LPDEGAKKPSQNMPKKLPGVPQHQLHYDLPINHPVSAAKAPLSESLPSPFRMTCSIKPSGNN